MALDLSKLRKNVQPTVQNNTDSSSTRLNLSGLRVQAQEPTTDTTSGTSFNGLNLTAMNATTPVANNQGFKLSFTEGETYDLDELVQSKQRDQSTAPLVLQNGVDALLQARLVEFVTKKILNDYNIPYTEETYKTVVSKVPNFSRIFDSYTNKYYKSYLEYIGNDAYDGSIALDTIFREIAITTSDVKNYTLEDVATADKKGQFLSYLDRYRPMIIWTDGTPDGNDGEVDYDKTDIDSDNLATWLALVLKSNNAIKITRNQDDKVYLDVDYQKLAAEYSAGSKEYFDQIATIASINSELLELQEQMSTISELLGTGDVGGKAKAFNSKYLWDATDAEKEGNYINIKMSVDPAFDEMINGTSATITDSTYSDGSKGILMKNTGDYDIKTLSDGSLSLESVKLRLIFANHILEDGSYILTNEALTRSELSDGSFAISGNGASFS